MSKVKKLDDGHYYKFKVYEKIIVQDGKKKVRLIFHARQNLGKSKLNFIHDLQDYTTNQDSLIKISNFMVEYCLVLNNKFQLYFDNELYSIHKDKMRETESIIFHETQAQTDLLVPSMKTQNRMATNIQKLAKGFLARRNKSKTKLIKKIIYQV